MKFETSFLYTLFFVHLCHICSVMSIQDLYTFSLSFTIALCIISKMQLTDNFDRWLLCVTRAKWLQLNITSSALETANMIVGKILIISLCGGFILTIDSTAASRSAAAKYPLPFERYALASRSPFDVANTAADNVDYRLPNNTRPLAYNLRLSTNVHLGDFTVTGQVRVTIEVLTTGSRAITLHYAQLSLDAVQLFEIGDNGQTLMAVDSPEYTDITQSVTVTLASDQPDLVVGRHYELAIEFSGTLRDDGRGFFRSSYVNDDGNTR